MEIRVYDYVTTGESFGEILSDADFDSEMNCQNVAELVEENTETYTDPKDLELMKYYHVKITITEINPDGR